MVAGESAKGGPASTPLQTTSGARSTKGPNAHRNVVPQCLLVSRSIKITENRYSIKLSDTSATHGPHKRVWWRQPPTSRWLRAQHPSLKADRPVSLVEWKLLRSFMLDGYFGHASGSCHPH